jgi:hypothetical protein
MIIRVGLENGIEGRSLAWPLDFPGCFAYGEDGPTALMNLPRALINHEAWVSKHTPRSWVALGDFDIRLIETWQVFDIHDGHAVYSWFQDDIRSLTGNEIQNGLDMLRWNRADLLEVVSSLDPGRLDRRYPGERWSIRGILAHIAEAERWHLDWLGLVGEPQRELPEDCFEALADARSRLMAALPSLSGAIQVVEKDGETFSPRKLLRRALWHERDHILHIYKLVLG